MRAHQRHARAPVSGGRELATQQIDLAHPPSKKARRRLIDGTRALAKGGDQIGCARRCESRLCQLEASGTDGAHRSLVGQVGEQGAFAVREAGGEQVNVPEPQQIFGVAMVCDAVETREKQRIRGGQRQRIRTERP